MMRIIKAIQVMAGWFVIIESLILMLKEVLAWNLILHLAQYDYLLFPAVVTTIVGEFIVMRCSHENVKVTAKKVVWEWGDYTC